MSNNIFNIPGVMSKITLFAEYDYYYINLEVSNGYAFQIYHGLPSKKTLCMNDRNKASKPLITNKDFWLSSFI